MLSSHSSPRRFTRSSSWESLHARRFLALLAPFSWAIPSSAQVRGATLAAEAQIGVGAPVGQEFSVPMGDEVRRLRLRDVGRGTLPMTLGLGYRFPIHGPGAQMTVGVSLLYAPFLGVAREDAALGSFEQPIDSAYVLRPSLRVAVHHPINAATRFTYGLRLGPEFLRLRAVGEQGEADSAVTLMALAFSEFDVALDLQVADRIWLGPFGAASVGMYSMSYADGEFRVVTDSMDAFERTHLWFATGLRGAFVL